MSMHKYFACELSNIGVIPLGRTGEHKATSISIDATEWRKEHPGGVLALLVRSPAGVTYPATVETDGNTLTWTLTADETSVAGSGEIELILSDSGYVCKSARCPTQLEEALTQNSDAPPAGKPEWVSELIAAIPAIEGFPETAKKAEDIISEASTATEDAKAAAGNANREAGNANKAAEAANTAAENWDSSFAADSAKLGGKSPAEYASAAEVSQLKSEKVDKANVVNNFTTTQEGFVADARALKALNEKSAVLYSGTIHITTDGIAVNLSDRSINYEYLIVHLGSSAGGSQFLSIISPDGNSFVKCFTTWYGEAIVQFSFGSYTECTVSLKDLANYPSIYLSKIIGIKL